MKKEEFLSGLNVALRHRLRKDDIADIMADYEEYFSVGEGEGKTEELLCASFGSPEQIANTLFENTAPADRGITTDIIKAYTPFLLVIAAFFAISFLSLVGITSQDNDWAYSLLFAVLSTAAIVAPFALPKTVTAPQRASFPRFFFIAMAMQCLLFFVTICFFSFVEPSFSAFRFSVSVSVWFNALQISVSAVMIILSILRFRKHGCSMLFVLFFEVDTLFISWIFLASLSSRSMFNSSDIYTASQTMLCMFAFAAFGALLARMACGVSLDKTRSLLGFGIITLFCAGSFSCFPVLYRVITYHQNAPSMITAIVIFLVLLILPLLIFRIFSKEKGESPTATKGAKLLYFSVQILRAVVTATLVIFSLCLFSSTLFYDPMAHSPEWFGYSGPFIYILTVTLILLTAVLWLMEQYYRTWLKKLTLPLSFINCGFVFTLMCYDSVLHRMDDPSAIKWAIFGCFVPFAASILFAAAAAITAAVIRRKKEVR